MISKKSPWQGRDIVRVLRRGEEGAERDKSKWELLIKLVQMAFRDRVILEGGTW